MPDRVGAQQHLLLRRAEDLEANVLK